MLSNAPKPVQLGVQLMAAAEAGDVGGVQQCLVQASTSLNDRDSDGRTALICACLGNGQVPESQFLETVKLLVRHGADVNARDCGGKSALMAACSRGHVQVVQYLVGCGARLNAFSETRQTALDMAAGTGQAVNYLRANGAKHYHELYTAKILSFDLFFVIVLGCLLWSSNACRIIVCVLNAFEFVAPALLWQSLYRLLSLNGRQSLSIPGLRFALARRVVGTTNTRWDWFGIVGPSRWIRLQTLRLGYMSLSVEPEGGLADRLFSLVECLHFRQEYPHAKIRFIWSINHFCRLPIDCHASTLALGIHFVLREHKTLADPRFRHWASMNTAWHAWHMNGSGGVLLPNANFARRVLFAPWRTQILDMLGIPSQNGVPSQLIDKSVADYGVVHLRFGDYVKTFMRGHSTSSVAERFFPSLRALLQSNVHLSKWYIISEDLDFVKALRQMSAGRLAECPQLDTLVWPRESDFGESMESSCGQVKTVECTREEVVCMLGANVLAVTVGRFGVLAACLGFGQLVQLGFGSARVEVLRP